VRDKKADVGSHVKTCVQHSKTAALLGSIWRSSSGRARGGVVASLSVAPAMSARFCGLVDVKCERTVEVRLLYVVADVRPVM
jgi:hypothetical protein